MRWRMIIGFVALVIGSADALGNEPTATLKRNSPWLTDYALARSTARESDKLLFVVFR